MGCVEYQLVLLASFSAITGYNVLSHQPAGVTIPHQRLFYGVEFAGHLVLKPTPYGHFKNFRGGVIVMGSAASKFVNLIIILVMGCLFMAKLLFS